MKAQRKKKTKIMWITIGMIAALCGCGSKQTSEEASAVDAVQTQQAQEITVTFMKGEETLGTVQTLAGEIIECDTSRFIQQKKRSRMSLIHPGKWKTDCRYKPKSGWKKNQREFS